MTTRISIPQERESVELDPRRAFTPKRRQITNQHGTSREWTAAEDDYVESHIGDGAAAIAVSLNRSVGAVLTRVKRLGIDMFSAWVRQQRALADTPEWQERALMRLVEYDTNGGCWLCSQCSSAYGRITINGQTFGAHVLSWTLFRGPIPHGLIVCHKCDVTPCMNPDHLFLGTYADNTHDMIAKGRNDCRIGELNPSVRLSAGQVISIRHRREAGDMAKDLADEFGVSRSTISDIMHRRSWAHI